MLTPQESADFIEFCKGQRATRICQLERDSIKLDFANGNSIIFYVDTDDNTVSFEVI